MEMVIKKWGNSLAARIPAVIAKALKIDVNQRMKIETHEGKIILTPINDIEYDLDDLLSRCSSDQFILDEEDKEWMNAKPVGKEIW